MARACPSSHGRHAVKRDVVHVYRDVNRLPQHAAPTDLKHRPPYHALAPDQHVVVSELLQDVEHPRAAGQFCAVLREFAPLVLSLYMLDAPPSRLQVASSTRYTSRRLYEALCRLENVSFNSINSARVNFEHLPRIAFRMISWRSLVPLPPLLLPPPPLERSSLVLAGLWRAALCRPALFSFARGAHTLYHKSRIKMFRLRGQKTDLATAVSITCRT